MGIQNASFILCEVGFSITPILQMRKFMALKWYPHGPFMVIKCLPVAIRLYHLHPMGKADISFLLFSFKRKEEFSQMPLVHFLHLIDQSWASHSFLYQMLAGGGTTFDSVWPDPWVGGQFSNNSSLLHYGEGRNSALSRGGPNSHRNILPSWLPWHYTLGLPSGSLVSISWTPFQATLLLPS